MSVPALPESKRKFLGVEIARGVAASMVAIYHAGMMLMKIDRSGYEPFGGVTFSFHVGVDFFFVLSGFLITWIHWRDIGNPKRLKTYVLKRFARVYPVYWCILIPLIAAHLFAGRDSFSSIVTSFLLFPTVGDPILGVAWTLVFEVFFYLSFAAMILGGRWMVLLLPVWVIAIIVHHEVWGAGSYPIAFVLDPYNLEFVVGIVVGHILRRARIPAPAWILVLGIVIFMGAASIHIGALVGYESLKFRAVFGVSAAMIILSIVEIDRSGTHRYPKWLLMFGTASYSIYLVHTPVEAGAAKLLRPLMGHVSAGILLIVIAAIGIGAGILFHLAIERKVLARVNGFFFPERQKNSSLPDGPLLATGFAEKKGVK